MMNVRMMTLASALVFGTISAASAQVGFSSDSKRDYSGVTVCVHTARQVGNGVSDGTTQNCQYNVSAVVQTGNGTSSSVRQSGGNNTSATVQFGDRDTANISQRGPNNRASGVQVGNGSRFNLGQR